MKTYSKQDVLTLLKAHLVQVTVGNLTDTEFRIIAEVDCALKERPSRAVNSLGSRVGNRYPKPVAA